MHIRIAARGMQNNVSFIDAIKNSVDDETELLLDKLFQDIIAEAKHNIQQNQAIDSGRLLGSVKVLERGRLRGVIGTELDYAFYVEFGRGPITAEPGKVLTFVAKDGTRVFTKSVGPAEPQPFLEPAVMKLTKKFSDVLVEAHEDIAKKHSTNLLDSELL